MIIVLIGRMAAGKDTVINAINKELKIPILVSHTTRPMRPGETNHKEYHFVDNDYFLEEFRLSNFIEYRAYEVADGSIWYYGLHKSEPGRISTSIVIMDPTGYESLLNYFGEENVIGILLEADKETVFNRALLRNGDTIEEIKRRIADDDRRFNNFKEKHPECFIVNNNNDAKIDDVVQQIEDIITKIIK